MADLPEKPEFHEGIFQLETTTPNKAGPVSWNIYGQPTDGWLNAPISQLADRTRWLKDNLESGIVRADGDEAKAGIDNNKLMTPLRVHEAFKQYGLGTYAVTIQDANSIRTSGFFKTGASWEGSVFPGAHGFNQGVLLHHGLDPNYGVQYFHPMQSHRYYARFLDNGVWSEWAQIYNTHTILGTVSQSNGVPTGAIIERGSNANGDYVRFADGTQICWYRSETQYQTSSVLDSLFFNNGETFIFPSSFSNEPRVFPALLGGTSGWSHISGYAFGTSATQTSIGGYGTRAVSSFYPGYVAIGRWF